MKIEPPAGGKAAAVRAMFSRVAPRYDLMNRLMTAGQDIVWRREVIGKAELAPGARLLDLGAGTGDLAREALRQQPDCTAIAADFTLGMMRTGMRNTSSRLQWSAADALQLPFADEYFDAVVSGFLLRNVSDIPQALREQRRVLRAGGRIVVLDTTKPVRSVLTPLIRLHMRHVIPMLGRLVTGEREAYEYLPSSSEAFLGAEELADYMKEAGYQQIGFRRRNAGTIAIHWGRKAGE
jgi:demethylmenaquinone methyltransferase/2-methoxy-6-polyprenyl-1,4-benzoquinol methylase